MPVRMLLLALLGLSVPVSIAAARQDPRDVLTAEEERERQALLGEVLKAKPGTQPLNLANLEIRRQFDLSGRTEQYGLLRLNRSMTQKRYTHDGDFVAYYVSRFNKLFEEKARNAWVLAYASQNKTEKEFFDKRLAASGLSGEKRDRVVLSYYSLQLPLERAFYIDLVQAVYKKGTADFSSLPKRAKDWVAEHNDLFP